MKLKDKVKRYYSIIEEEIWERSEKNILFRFLSYLSCIPYRVEFRINRFRCYLFGCKEKGGYGGFNLPIEAYYYCCDICGAVESNYEGNTNYSMLEGIFKRR
jgi:hypothetical protein